MIKREIEQSLTGLTRNGESLVAHFLFTEDFIGFQGHFPGKKVLPGVCQIQCVLTMIEKAHKLPVFLKEIMVAKYMSPIRPGEKITCTCSDLQKRNADQVVKAVITKENAKISELKLRFRFAENTEAN